MRIRQLIVCCACLVCQSAGEVKRRIVHTPLEHDGRRSGTAPKVKEVQLVRLKTGSSWSFEVAQRAFNHAEPNQTVLSRVDGDESPPIEKSMWRAWAFVCFFFVCILLAMSPIFFRFGALAFATTLAYGCSLMVIKPFMRHMMTSGLAYPYSITFLHMVTTAIGAACIDRPQMSEARSVLPISLMTGASLLLNNKALVLGSAAFVAMVGSWTPGTTLMMELISQRNCFDERIILVAIVCIGGMLCAFGETAFSMTALILALSATLCRSGKLVGQHKLLQVQLPPHRLVAWNAIWCCVIVLPMALVFEGHDFFLKLFQASGHVKRSFVASAVAATTLNVTGCMALKYQGPVQQNILGNMLLIMMIQIATLYLGETVTTLQFLGMGMNILSCLLLSVRKMHSAKADAQLKDAKLPAGADPKVPAVG